MTWHRCYIRLNVKPVCVCVHAGISGRAICCKMIHNCKKKHQHAALYPVTLSSFIVHSFLFVFIYCYWLSWILSCCNVPSILLILGMVFGYRHALVIGILICRLQVYSSSPFKFKLNDIMVNMKSHMETKSVILGHMMAFSYCCMHPHSELTPWSCFSHTWEKQKQNSQAHVSILVSLVTAVFTTLRFVWRRREQRQRQQEEAVVCMRGDWCPKG